MKVFEFHFNPLSDDSPLAEVVFNSFCFLPQKRREKRLGCLYLIGEIERPEQESKALLAGLANEIQQGFYEAQEPSQAFQLGMNSANNFIAKALAKGDLNNLGYLHFAALSISPKCLVFFSKTGSIKVLLLRDREVFNMAPNQSPANLTGGIFANIIEGALQKRDKVLILTKSVFEAFQAEKILEALALIKTPKEVKELFKQKKKILKEFSGACLLSFVKKTREPFALPNFLSKRKSIKYAPAGKFEKGIISAILLVILLLLGYLIF